MPDKSSSTGAGLDLLSAKRRLESEQPGLVKGYQQFLENFAEYRALQRQFEEDRTAGPAQRPAMAARPRYPR